MFIIACNFNIKRNWNNTLQQRKFDLLSHRSLKMGYVTLKMGSRSWILFQYSSWFQLSMWLMYNVYLKSVSQNPRPPFFWCTPWPRLNDPVPRIRGTPLGLDWMIQSLAKHVYPQNQYVLTFFKHSDFRISSDKKITLHQNRQYKLKLWVNFVNRIIFRSLDHSVYPRPCALTLVVMNIKR